jgi:predicted ferric reductase
MSGGMMTMGAGVPSLFYMQQIFWAFVGSAIGVAAFANLLNQIIYRQRISASRTAPNAAKPKSFFFQAHATISAMIREYSYYSSALSFRKMHFYLPPVGPMTVLVAYIVLIVVCCLYAFNPDDLLQWEDIGYRSGFIAISQIPLIILLAGKRNIIGFFTGVGYERLSWLHRWAARALLFTVLIHMGFWMTEWGKFDYIMVKIKTDPLTQKGIAAGSVLAWLLVSSVAPIRGLSYEIFVVQHIISFLGFLAAVYLHVPDENRIWVWLPLGFWAFDRLVRAVYLVYNNISLLHKNSTGLLACRATFETLDESHTRITIANPPVTWKAGQHMFLACHPVAPLSSHPFTIATLPEDGKIEFIVRAKKGATKRFFKYAEKVYPSLPSSSTKKSGRGVLIDGPYARVRPLRQFDSLVFVAGSTGATFTVPLMRDIVQQWQGIKSASSRFSLEPAAGAVTRHIRFVWVVKRKAAVSWFGTQLDKVMADVEALRNEGHDIAVDINIYVTCDDTITSGLSSVNGDVPSSSGRVEDLYEKSPSENIVEVSSRTPSAKECCCTRVIADEDAVNAPCNCGSRLQRSSSASSFSLDKSDRVADSRISVLSGRPHVSNIIRKTAELALGEMAVVVCGPPGLVRSTRNATVQISNDRAVHKGTGAQGIYVHAEAFGYA